MNSGHDITVDVFLPQMLRRSLEQARADEDDVYEQRCLAAMIFVDVAGFSVATDEHSRGGPEGIERLTALLNDTFGHSIAIALDHGGDVVSFAGDAFSALWTVTAEGSAASRELADASVRAAQCALAVQASLAERLGSAGAFAVRIAITCGEVAFVEIGGEGSQRLYFAGGEVQAQLSETMAEAAPGEVWISTQARASTGMRLMLSTGEAGCARLERVRSLLEPQPAKLPSLSPEALARARRYVPAVALDWLDSGLSRWVAELRTVSVAFVSLPMPEPGNADALAGFQAGIAELMAVTERYEGGVNKLSVDEKGMALIAAWGIPPFSHEDDASRAVRAMLEYEAILRHHSVPVRIGVATGPVYSGLIGGKGRREYTMMGQPVNLAARLAQIAAGRIVCDAATHKAALNVGFEAAGAVRVKNIRAEVETFVPTGVRQERASRSDMAIVGRSQERDTIVEWLDRYQERREGGVLLIQGEPGIGKSRLLDFLCKRAHKRNIRTIFSEADAINRNAPYYAWRRVLMEVIGVPLPAAVDDLPARIVAEVEQRLGSHDHYLPVVPLLSDILAVELPETEFSRTLQDEARANNLSRLVARLLKNTTDPDPLIVVIDDAHWFDSASWALLYALVRTVKRIAFVVSHRPMSEPLPVEWTALREHEDNVIVDLGRMSDGAVQALLHRALEVDQVSPELEKLIVDKAEGNPFYTEQLALSLRDAGLVVREGRSAAVRIDQSAADSLASLDIPATVQGVVLSRLDRLPTRQQLFIKIASVLGRTFDANLAIELFPDDESSGSGVDGDPFRALVDELVEQRVFTRPSPSSPVLEFRHMIMRDAVYKALLRAQRVDLHGSVLARFERDGVSGERLPALVHHALHAEQWNASLRYLEQAGELSLSRSANRECITYFERAFEVATKLGAPPPAEQRARWRWHLSEAYFRVGDVEPSLDHGLVAIELYGIPMPKSGFARTRRLMRLIAERNFPRLRRSYTPSDDPDLNRRRGQVLALQARMTDSFGYKMDIVGMVLSSSRELALADALDRPGQAASAHMMLYFIATLTPLKATVQPWLERALELVEHEADPSVKGRVLARVALAKVQDQANFEHARALITSAHGIAQAHGDMRLLAEVEAGIAFMAMCRGEPVKAVAAYRSMARATRYSGDMQMGAWAKIGTAHARLLLGDPNAAFRLAREVREWGEQATAFASHAWVLGVLAQAAFEVGERELARELADKLLARTIKEPVLGAYWMWGGLEGLCETFLGLDDLASAKLAVKQIERFANSLPFAEPSARYYRGRLIRALGRSAKAIAQLEACLEATERVRLPRIQLLAHRQLAELHGRDTPEGAAHHRGAETLSASLATSTAALESGPGASQSMPRVVTGAVHTA